MLPPILHLADGNLSPISPVFESLSTQRRYYINQLTHVSSWDIPDSGPLPPPPSQPSSALPRGWIQQYDPTSQRPYYHNTITQETSWHPPAAVAAPALAPLADGWQQITDHSGRICYVNERLQIMQHSPPPAAQPPSPAPSSRRFSVAEQQEVARGAFRTFDQDR